jgi:hypothetical protein
VGTMLLHIVQGHTRVQVPLRRNQLAQMKQRCPQSAMGF